jgi:hypothetical protein
LRKERVEVIDLFDFIKGKIFYYSQYKGFIWR